jgi:hypothetical protein
LSNRGQDLEALATAVAAATQGRRSPTRSKKVLKETAPFSEADLERIADNIKEPIGVKKLLMVTKMARQEGDASISADNFLACLSNCGL